MRRLLLWLVPALFVLLQFVFAAYLMQLAHRQDGEGDARLLEQEGDERSVAAAPHLQPHKLAEAAAEEDAIASVAPAEAGVTSPARLGLHEMLRAAGGGREARKVLQQLRGNGTLAQLLLSEVCGHCSGHGCGSVRVRLVKRVRLASQELRWNFGENEVEEDALTLHRCIGKGSYGTVLEGSVRRGGSEERVVVKMPTIRHWGFRFYRTEMDALQVVRAAQRGGGASRLAAAARKNVVELRGNTSVRLSALLALDETAEAWGCLNHTDLRLARLHGVRQLPAMLLEPLSRASVFKWLAAVGAPKEGASLSLQRRFFRLRYLKATSADSEYRHAFGAAFDVLLGFARGIALLHSLHLVHRDLTEPGKNVLLRPDAAGLTATIIDLSQAQHCPHGRGAAARAVDMYAFGHVLYFACYGRIVHGLPWTKFSCNGSPEALAGLLSVHEGRVSNPGHINRCSASVQTPLHELMQYCWEPALLVARAHTVGVGSAARSARSNHSWDYVIERLLALRQLGVPLLDADTDTRFDAL